MAVENNDVLRVSCKMSLFGQDVQNVFYIRNNGAGSVDDTTAVTEVLARLDSAFVLQNGEITNNLSYDSIEIFNITQDRPMGEYAWPTLTVGGAVSEALPNQVSGLVLFPTTTARSQGRTYLGGHVEGNNSSTGVPDGGALAAMAAWAAALIAPWLVGGGEFEFGNWSSEKLRFAAYVSSLVRDVWRTQRRRAQGVGS